VCVCVCLLLLRGFCAFTPRVRRATTAVLVLWFPPPGLVDCWVGTRCDSFYYHRHLGYWMWFRSFPGAPDYYNTQFAFYTHACPDSRYRAATVTRLFLHHPLFPLPVHTLPAFGYHATFYALPQFYRSTCVTAGSLPEHHTTFPIRSTYHYTYPLAFRVYLVVRFILRSVTRHSAELHHLPRCVLRWHAFYARCARFCYR